MFLFLMSALEEKRTLTDDIIIKVGEEDKEAFRILYELSDKAVYGYALSIVKNVQDAEDIMQDTFIRIREAAHLYQPKGKPMAWVLTITKNLCYMKLRQKQKTLDTLSEEMENDIHLSYQLQAEDKLVLDKAFQILSDMERQIVILHIVSGLKHREIAKLVGCPLGSILSKYNRAIKKLRNHLSEGGL